MENQAPFDLNQALQQWRASLQNLSDFRADELEELEGHLCESMNSLHARGLSDREAFMIATRRLGSERQLSDEFVKANPQRTWTERAMWMVAGVLAAYTVSIFATPVVGIILNCAMWSGLNGHLYGAFHLLVRWVVWAGAAGSAYWAFSRHISRRNRLVQTCIQRPVLTGLGLFIGLECLQSGMWHVTRLAEPMFSFFSGHQAPISQPNLDVINSWGIWGSLLTQLLWIAAGPLLAAYAWRKRGRLASESPASHEMAPGEREAVRAWRTRDSRDEASLLLGWRRCPQEVIAPSTEPASDRSVWLERAIWMVAGIAFSQCLEMLVLQVGWLPAMVFRPAAPLYQHLTALTSSCLSLLLGGALITVLWRWVTRHPSQSALVGGIFCRRPLLATIALVAVCVGVGLSEYALFTYTTRQLALPAQRGTGPIASQWFLYSHALSQLIIPIALLLWLARLSRGMQTNPAPCR